MDAKYFYTPCNCKIPLELYKLLQVLITQCESCCVGIDAHRGIAWWSNSWMDGGILWSTTFADVF